jgi:hypothetical protein
MHYCASTHQTSLESKSRLNQEHKAQGKEARAFFGVHQKRSKSVRERLDGPFLKERERRDGPSVQRRRREIGVGFAARTASLRLRPVFFFKKKSPCSPLSPGFPCPPYARPRRARAVSGLFSRRTADWLYSVMRWRLIR